MKSILLSLIILLSISVQAQRLEWAGGILSQLDKEARSISTDGQGNVYAYGEYSTMLDVDPDFFVEYRLTSVIGTDDLYLVKLDSAGHFVWAKSFGGYQDDMASKVTVDDSGNVFITGLIYGVVDFDPDTASTYYLGATNTAQAFVVKLNTDGNFVWAKSIKGSTDDFAFATSLHVDSWNNVYVGGVYDGVVDFDSDSSVTYLDSTIHFGGLFVCKLNALGEFNWVKTYGEGSGNLGVTDITSDAAGYIYATGSAEGVDFPTGNVYGAFILKLDTAGTHIWDKSLRDQGNGNGIDAHSIGVDAVGSVYIGGSGWNPDFNPDPVLQHYIGYTVGAFILKLNSNGEYVWVWNAGGEAGAGGNHTYSLKVSPTGFIYATGAFVDSFDFDNGPAVRKLYAKGNLDAFILKLDTARNLIWANGIGGVSVDRGKALAINDDEDVFTSGNFMKLIDADPSDTLVYNIFGPDWDNHYVLNNIYVQKLKNVSCSNLAIVVDSVKDVTCANAGKIWAHGINGSGLTYQWNTTPAQNTSTLTTTNPGMYTINITDDDGCTSSARVFLFGPSSQQQGYDLNANLIAGEFRTGFNTYIQLDALNERCTPISGTLQLVLDSLVQYDSAAIAPSLISGDTLIWNFANLIYDSAHVTPRVYLTTLLSAIGGNSVCFDLIMKPDSADADTTNNTKQYCFPVVNAYDPNYIAVHPKGECVPAYVQKSLPLSYTIHFQNTGNSRAINVYLLDTLSANLDINSINVVAQSHSVITQLMNDNVLQFRFDNIMLIDSATHPDSSQGYVVYEVSPIGAVTENTVLTNRAAIYFDYNEPVITNNVLNTLVTGPVDSTYCNTIIGISETSKYNVAIYPNPNTGSFVISTDGTLVENIDITDISGRLVFSQTAVNSGIVNLELNQVSGIYFVAVKCNGITTTHKLIKY